MNRQERVCGAGQTGTETAAEDTRSKILRVTRSLIAAQGVHGATLAAVAREAQISRGTLFYYFPSKQSLLFQVMEDSFAEISDRIMQAVEGLNPGSSRLNREKFFYLALQLVGEAKSLNRINFHLFQQAIAGNRSLREKFREFYRKWRRLIAERLQELFPEASRRYSPEALSALVLALVDGVSIQALLEEGLPDYRETARIMDRIFDVNDPASGYGH